MTPEHVQQMIKRVAFKHTWHPRECECVAGQTIFTCPAVNGAIELALAAARADGAVEALRDSRRVLKRSATRSSADANLSRKLATAEAKQTETHARLAETISKGET